MHSVKFRIKTGIISLIALCIAGYSFYQARNIIIGPKIVLFSPIDGSTAVDPISIINGRAGNVAYISLNDKPIFINKEGEFSEKLLLSEGYNIIKIEARDKFGRKIQKMVRLILPESVEASARQSIINATSSAKTITDENAPLL